MLKEKMPERYLKSTETMAILQLLNPSVIAADTAVEDLFQQLFVETATWGLAFHEKEYDIAVESDKPFSFRRSRLLAKKKGVGTVSKAMVKSVAEGFANAVVEIDELFENDVFLVKFVGTVGVPPNLEDLTAALDELKPTHLLYRFVFFYNTYGDIRGVKHSRLTGRSHEDIRNRRI